MAFGLSCHNGFIFIFVIIHPYPFSSLCNSELFQISKGYKERKKKKKLEREDVTAIIFHTFLSNKYLLLSLSLFIASSATLSSPYLVSSYLSLPLSLTHTLTNQTKPSSRIEISGTFIFSDHCSFFSSSHTQMSTEMLLLFLP